ncbi:GUN4 domain-containing protein [Kalymmatonema gypsitolerans NIES-4073]|nr:GUN4 domain-containing protein [Scytonema sp. NIES-4073]
MKEKLTGKGLDKKAIEISEKANIKIKDPQLEQVHLHASKSLAYQSLNDWKLAEESINQSTNFFRVLKFNKSKKEQSESNSEFLQTEIFVLTVQGNLFRERNQTLLAIEAYQKAFNLLQSNSNQLNPFKKQPQIINTTTVERVHRGYLELLTTNSTQGNDFLSKVRESLKEHYIAELDNLLENKKWEAADRLTLKLMLYIAKREKEGYLDAEDIKTFSCPDLRRIDANWKNHSDGHFGFGVQKKIWLFTGNRQEYNEEAYGKFLSRLRWNEWDYDMIIREVEKDYSKAPVGILPYYYLLRYDYLGDTLPHRQITYRYLRLKVQRDFSNLPPQETYIWMRLGKVLADTDGAGWGSYPYSRARVCQL